MSPINPVPHATSLVCPSCNAKIAAVVEDTRNGRLTYYSGPAFLVHPLGSGLTEPRDRVFDAMPEAAGDFPLGTSAGRARIVCRCGRYDQVFRDETIRSLLHETNRRKVTLPK